ncbi:glycerate kinase type-2 family protein [Pseudemcibacter aquimaris]|uniref:glycerate kinase type-2 family protein n=1 Tax=Pseudemcibacter aquimaris TaxID=2857064 RepID=UPI002011FADC|nr:glycerate kinase [Pseudemcibacter aquimaris]MCC3860785.1 glycerate kinase [Pseudemcibacter aquimaris]WDU59605.1 glycerate kinase [Pseudemcibacter aquimaris]
MTLSPDKYLKELFQFAVRCSHPKTLLKKHLPENTNDPVTIIGAGKAGAAMAQAFESVWKGPISGTVVVPHGQAVECNYIDIIQASHPVPDQNSVIASEIILNKTRGLTDKDTVFALISGGGSSLLCSPTDKISLDEKQLVNKQLLKSGASIDEMNIVRKKLSNIKGGKLLSHIHPAKLRTLAISDVVGDDPTTIASGPTVPDHSTNQDALQIIRKYIIDIPESVKNHLSSDEASPDHSTYNYDYSVIASARIMLKNVQEKIENDGFNCINLGELDGDAKSLGFKHAEMAMALIPEKPTIIISGGETTVKVIGNGKGGRNSEYLLGLFSKLSNSNNIYALSADTDGIDGMMDNAGAYFLPGDIGRDGLAPESYLNNNDSYSFFKKMDRLIITGPTHTNVNDFRAIYIAPK